MRRLGAVAALSAVVVAAGCGADKGVSTQSSPVPPAVAQMTPLVGSVPFAPIPFKGSDGLTHLVYELWVTNFTSGELTIRDVAALDAASGKQIGELDTGSLEHRVYPAGAKQPTNVLQPGQAAMVFIHVPLADEKLVPQQLTHRVQVTAAALPPGSAQVTEQLAPTTVDRRTLPVLSAPLAGERYIGADGCCDAPRHTRAVLPINGQLYLAQRYAVDFEQADAQNRIFTGDPKDPKSYQIFGKEVYAVADGTVVGTRNDLPEQTPGTYPANIGVDEADGNFVVLDIGNGFYVNYAHMQPGSVRPKVGERVKRGDVIGLVGNSGNSVAPHLHLHVMDGPSPLAAQGLPYLYDTFTTTGQVASTGAFDAAEATGIPLALVADATRTEHTDEMVLDQNLVTFSR
ncbi:metalloendopeptidase [Mycolicibacterium sphagni]|uniref:Metalloendopeptidase n=1 Tax=Mycolicibacterium sphagni TaxID=1786 RepID=A0A255DKK8_9MYCO|nr:metalloendopeptidase [Mycolicibacterium sphagni]